MRESIATSRDRQAFAASTRKSLMLKRRIFWLVHPFLKRGQGKEGERRGRENFPVDERQTEYQRRA